MYQFSNIYLISCTIFTSLWTSIMVPFTTLFTCCYLNPSLLFSTNWAVISFSYKFDLLIARCNMDSFNLFVEPFKHFFNLFKFIYFCLLNCLISIKLTMPFTMQLDYWRSFSSKQFHFKFMPFRTLSMIKSSTRFIWARNWNTKANSTKRAYPIIFLFDWFISPFYHWSINIPFKLCVPYKTCKMDKLRFYPLLCCYFYVYIGILVIILLILLFK